MCRCSAILLRTTVTSFLKRVSSRRSSLAAPSQSPNNNNNNNDSNTKQTHSGRMASSKSHRNNNTNTESKNKNNLDELHSGNDGGPSFFSLQKPPFESIGATSMQAGGQPWKPIIDGPGTRDDLSQWTAPGKAGLRNQLTMSGNFVWSEGSAPLDRVRSDAGRLLKCGFGDSSPWSPRHMRRQL